MDTSLRGLVGDSQDGHTLPPEAEAVGPEAQQPRELVPGDPEGQGKERRRGQRRTSFQVESISAGAAVQGGSPELCGQRWVF